MNRFQNDLFSGAPLIFRWCSGGLPSLVGENALRKTSDIWCSVVLPPCLHWCSVAGSPENEANYLSFG